MKCEYCHVNEATIHLTQVVDGKIKKLNLCEECAKKSGIDLTAPISITDVLLGLGQQNQNVEIGSEYDLSCPRCHMTRAEFKRSGRLGCPECYQTFMGDLNTLIKAMHRGGQHVGKIPARQGNRARIVAQVAALQKDLEAAVAKEQYEIAANLRDKIKALKKSLDAQEKGTKHDAR